MHILTCYTNCMELIMMLLMNHSVNIYWLFNVESNVHPEVTKVFNQVAKHYLSAHFPYGRNHGFPIPWHLPVIVPKHRNYCEMAYH